MQEFTGKVAVVTGAGSGIGRGLALRWAAEGIRVAMIDIDEAALQETAGLMAAASPDTPQLARRGDVSHAFDVDAFADDVFDEWGQVDLLCNNAGVFLGGYLWDRHVEDARAHPRRQPVGDPPRHPRRSCPA